MNSRAPSVFLLTVMTALSVRAAPPQYTVQAIHYGTMYSARELDNPRAAVAFILFLIRGEGRTILIDSGFCRPALVKKYNVRDFLAPDDAVRLAGVQPAEVTDIVVTHAHLDHIGGLDLFPKATIWIEAAEYSYYTGPAWQQNKADADTAEDVVALVRRNTQGMVRFVDGDDREVLAGIRMYTGGRHTFSSAYVRVDGTPAYVLGADDLPFYRYLEQHTATSTFEPGDKAANLAAMDRMVTLAGSRDRVVPGHDPMLFERFPTTGRVATIRR